MQVQIIVRSERYIKTHNKSYTKIYKGQRGDLRPLHLGGSCSLFPGNREGGVGGGFSLSYKNDGDTRQY